VAAGGAVLAATALGQFIAAHPWWAAATAFLLLLGFGGFLHLRRRAVEAQRRRFLAANATLEQVDRMTGPQFEQLVSERLRADGFRQVDVRGGAGDGGVDITAVAPGHGPCALQCKRYRKSVGAPEVRNFLGALANAFAGSTGILVTSGHLTKQARAEAQAARQPLVVVERDHLADWLLGTAALLPPRPWGGDSGHTGV
jgi:restriction system protein